MLLQVWRVILINLWLCFQIHIGWLPANAPESHSTKQSTSQCTTWRQVWRIVLTENGLCFLIYAPATGPAHTDTCTTRPPASSSRRDAPAAEQHLPSVCIVSSMQTLLKQQDKG
jgi:hypothetical protein